MLLGALRPHPGQRLVPLLPPPGGREQVVAHGLDRAALDQDPDRRGREQAVHRPDDLGDPELPGAVGRGELRERLTVATSLAYRNPRSLVPGGIAVSRLP